MTHCVLIMSPLTEAQNSDIQAQGCSAKQPATQQQQYSAGCQRLCQNRAEVFYSTYIPRPEIARSHQKKALTHRMKNSQPPDGPISPSSAVPTAATATPGKNNRQ